MRTGHDHQIAGVHQFLRQLLVHWCRQHLHQIRRQADLFQFSAHIADRLGGGADARRRRRDDHGVATFNRKHCLVDRGRSRVRGRGHGSNDTHRLGIFDQPFFRNFFDDADRFNPRQIAQATERLTLIFHDLAVDVAETGVFDRQCSKFARPRRFINRPSECGDRFVDPRLIGVGKLCHSGARLGDQAFDHVFFTVRIGRICRGFLGSIGAHDISSGQGRRLLPIFTGEILPLKTSQINIIDIFHPIKWDSDT